jgi:hypothetical protein
VITPYSPGYIDDKPNVLRYKSIPLPKRKPYRLGVPQFDFSFLKMINKIPFDLVHAHCPFSSGKLALNLSKKLNIPSIITFHSKFYDDFINIVKSKK